MMHILLTDILGSCRPFAIETENGNQRKELKAGDKPEATFALVPCDKVKSVYEYCNLHSLWKA